MAVGVSPVLVSVGGKAKHPRVYPPMIDIEHLGKGAGVRLCLDVVAAPYPARVLDIDDQVGPIAFIEDQVGGACVGARTTTSCPSTWSPGSRDYSSTHIGRQARCKVDQCA